jgi:phosphatidylserine/phosphatidylglycerophosphate/cardiolipin synthase-like enzyme
VSLLDSVPSWRVHDGAKCALLIDGRDYYRAFYEAVQSAEKSILLLGWQFDSDVELVRGDDVPDGATSDDVALLQLLDRLCRSRPELTTRVLAWDYSVFFALEREPLQKLYFDASTCERFVFRWDDTVPFGGSHHQKVAIIDGRVAFFGSQDICQSRWDDSSHRIDNPYRTARGAHYAPYHEVQVAVTGEPARSMVDLFIERWSGATGERLDPADLILGADPPDFPVTLPLPPARLALARTVPEVVGRPPVQEVKDLLVAAIERAERLVYIETQYLTSAAVRDALVRRMQDRSRSKLEIVIVLPHKPEKFKEEVTIGVPQAATLQALALAAEETGHSLGLYDVVAGERDDGEPVHVYIHSKLMIVDDRWLVTGSANFTNRSMQLDSEIVAAYEGPRSAIRNVRVRLLLEHLGEHADVRMLVRREGLVERLDALADRRSTRLRRYDRRKIEPSQIAKTVHELTLEFLDPVTPSSPS